MKFLIKPGFGVFALHAAFVGLANAQVLHLASCEQALVLRYGAVNSPVLSVDAAKVGVSLHGESEAMRLRCASMKPDPAASGISNSSSVTIQGARINQATGYGAVAEQNIGAQNAIARGEKKALPIIITVPLGWRIQARGWTGSLRANEGIWQADVELMAGAMHFAQLKDSRLIVDAGSLTAHLLHGKLSAHVRGAGNIEIERSNDALLQLQLTGVGNMTFKGRAKSAQISASGAGNIEIEKLIDEPRIQASSLVTIDIGR